MELANTWQRPYVVQYTVMYLPILGNMGLASTWELSYIPYYIVLYVVKTLLSATIPSVHCTGYTHVGE